MKSRLLFVILVIVFIASSLTAQENPFDTQYTITTFDYPGAVKTLAYGINDLGQIVGHYGEWPNDRGFLKDGDTFTTIDSPPNPTQPHGINNLGQIVGYYAAVTANGFLKDGDTFTIFTVPGPYPTTAHGINDLGQIIGSYSSFPSYGFLKDGDTFTTIDGPDGVTDALGINNWSQIVGRYGEPSYSHGFLTNDYGDTFITIDVPNAEMTAASGINDLGQIVGNYYDYDSSSGGVFLTNDYGDTFITIDVPGALGISPQEINNLGQIVGFFVDDSFFFHGFLATPLTVESALKELIENVEERLDTGDLTPNQSDGLIEKLYAVIESIENGYPADAINQLNAFINQVNGFIRARKLTPEEGQELIDYANSIIDQIVG